MADQRKALFMAVLRDDAAVVAKLLDEGADADMVSKNHFPPRLAWLSGQTPLLLSAMRGAADVVQALLGKASIDKPRAHGDIGRTPVMVAAEYGNLRCLKLIHAAGADLNHSDAEGNTALHLACKSNPDLRDEDDGYEDDWRLRTQIVRYLKDNGAEPDCANLIGDTPLFVLCNEVLARNLGEEGRLGILQILLDVRVVEGSSAQDQAAAHARTLMVNRVGSDGRTLATIASAEDDFDMLRLVAGHGADLTQAASHGDTEGTPMHHALRNQNIPMIEFLTDRGVGLEGCQAALVAARSFNPPTLLTYLVDKGLADLNEEDSEGYTPAHHIVDGLSLNRGFFFTAEFLFLPDINDPGELRKRHLQQKCDEEAHFRESEKAAHCAASTLRFLSDNGAVLARVDSAGMSLVHYAARAGEAHVVRTLARLGLSLVLQNNEHRSPLSVARKAYAESHEHTTGYEHLHLRETVSLLEGIESAGSWPKYVSAGRMAYARIRHHVCSTRKVLPDWHDDRELFHFLFGMNQHQQDHVVASPAARTGMRVVKVTRKEKQMLMAPRGVLKRVVEFLVS